MSHELRTPLNAILGYTQILSRHENLTQEQKEQLNTVYSSGKNLLSLINDLLDLSKIEAQSIRIEEKPFNLTDLLKEVYNITRINAEEKNLTFRFDTDFPVFENILGDPGKIKQILINLLNNAIKNTYTGGIVLKVSYGVIGSDILRCDIIDTGIHMSGIPVIMMKSSSRPDAIARAQLPPSARRNPATPIIIAILSVIGFFLVLLLFLGYIPYEAVMGAKEE